MKLNISLVALLLFCTTSLYSQISPGDLTAAHSHLEGLSNCTKCHELGQQVLNSKCLDCHSEIKQLITNNRGYHSNSEVKGKECWSCHSEHHGRNFRIISFNPDKFDHNKTGFKLTGSHRSIDCSECHNAELVINPNFKKKKHDTYLGLNTECKSCHEDYHQTTLGNNCEACHNTEKFRPAHAFDHSKAKYALTGKHLNVDCIKCHIIEKRNNKDFQKFNNLNFNNCSSCHTDVHRGSFGADCKSCHSTNGFNIINKSAFDHSRTKFPLIGKHKFVGCNDCHKGGLSLKPAFAKCIDCHSDYHKGEMVNNNLIRDCKECHNEYGFSPSIYTIEEHNLSAFKLTGSHLAVPCKSCHGKNDGWDFRNIGRKCIDCHNNVHGSELAAEYLPDDKCENCHITESWNTVNFNHSLTAFELSGKHKTIDCKQCHTSVNEVNEIKYRFSSLENNCEGCHKDIHFGQFTVDDKNDCSQCHTFDNWKPEKFDHSRTNFSLAGAHSKLECSRCHKEEFNNGNKFIKYKLEDFKCASCHF
jgi:hypothetical protein